MIYVQITCMMRIHCIRRDLADVLLYHLDNVQQRPGVETIVGAQSDPLYGPMLLIGSGGILVELVRDATMRLLPVSATDVSAMIDSLKVNRLLAGYRGKPPADRKALEAAAMALGRFYLDHRARIEEIEINPLIVRASGAVAVDVRVAWSKENK